MSKKNKAPKKVQETTTDAPVEKNWSEPNVGSAVIVPWGAFPSDTGTAVYPFNALQVSACYAAVRNIAEHVGGFPLYLYERTSKNGKAIIKDGPIIDLIEEPNTWQTRSELITYLTYSLVLNGNAYCFIDRDGAGRPINLFPISPYNMTIMIDQEGTGELFYRFTCPMFPNSLFACGSEDMIHIKSSITTPSGVWGMSPIDLGAQVLGNGISVQKAANVMFANGALIRGILNVSKKLTPQAAKNLGAEWQQAYESAANAGRTAVLEEGTTYTPIGQKADESQLLESRQFSVAEIARWFGIPPHKIGHMDGENYSTLVEGNQSYLDDTLMPICRKIESAFLRKLFIERADRRRYWFEFSTEDLLRANELDRAKAAQIWRFTGIKTQNELRERENLNPNPLPEGDTFLAPLNMTVSGKPEQTGGAIQQPIPPNADDGTPPDDDGSQE